MAVESPVSSHSAFRKEAESGQDAGFNLFDLLCWIRGSNVRPVLTWVAATNCSIQVGLTRLQDRSQEPMSGVTGRNRSQDPGLGCWSLSSRRRGVVLLSPGSSGLEKSHFGAKGVASLVERTNCGHSRHQACWQPSKVQGVRSGQTDTEGIRHTEAILRYATLRGEEAGLLTGLCLLGQGSLWGSEQISRARACRVHKDVLP